MLPKIPEYVPDWTGHLFKSKGCISIKHKDKTLMSMAEKTTAMLPSVYDSICPVGMNFAFSVCCLTKAELLAE